MNKPDHPPCGGCCTRLTGFSVAIGANQIIKDINLHVHCGELTAIIGPNGAGKTTLLRAMIGELPHDGELHFVHADGSSFGKPRIGYVPQKLDIDKTTPVNVIDLFSSLNSSFPLWLGHAADDRKKAVDMLKMVDGEQFADMRLSQLSCGQLQRVMLALALSPTPDLLLLDEPISGVDRTGINVFYKIVSRIRHEFDLSIFLISHDLTEVANFADRMILMDKSIICDGTPAQVLSSPETRRIFGIGPLPSPNGPLHEDPAIERINCPHCGNCSVKPTTDDRRPTTGGI